MPYDGALPGFQQHGNKERNGAHVKLRKDLHRYTLSADNIPLAAAGIG